jgi:site-specific DNA-methyltransferase (adenine-specific)
MSNLKMYRYDWVWNKTRGYNFQQANFAPMKAHENIMVFSKKPAIYSSKGSMVYFPIKMNGEIEHFSGVPTNTKVLHKSNFKPLQKKHKGFFPLSILTFKKDNGKQPTQKPVALLEYLIKTYTNENETVLDNCMGSGSTGVACKHTNRNFIGIELDDNYFEIAKKRIEEE